MRPGAPRAFALLTALSVSSGLAVGSCGLDNPGDDPPRGNVYFPTAVALSSATATKPARFLYVVNSNFDLRYNAGTLQAYDLDELDTAIATRCAKAPGVDCEIDPSEVLADEVWIPSFGTGVVASPDHTRLYVPTRAQASLVFVEIDETADGADEPVLDCGSRTTPRCDSDHERGDDSVQNGRRLRMPSDPVSVVTGPASDLAQPGETPIEGDYVLVAHREGAVSLFLDGAQGAGTSGPLLTDVLHGLPREITGLAFDVSTSRAYASIYDRTSGTISAKLLASVGVTIDDKSPEQSFLHDTGVLEIEGVSALRDTRALTFQSAKPSEALVVSRGPAALLWIDMQASMTELTPGHVQAKKATPVGAGPSRLATGTVGSTPVAAVSCFDARQVFVVHALTGAVLSIVRNLSGPFEIAIDGPRMRLYAADFRASVVRVIDLSPLATMSGSGLTEPTSARVVATLGSPKVIEELQ